MLNVQCSFRSAFCAVFGFRFSVEGVAQHRRPRSRHVAGRDSKQHGARRSAQQDSLTEPRSSRRQTCRRFQRQCCAVLSFPCSTPPPLHSSSPRLVESPLKKGVVPLRNGGCRREFVANRQIHNWDCSRLCGRVCAAEIGQAGPARRAVAANCNKAAMSRHQRTDAPPTDYQSAGGSSAR
jgi:hypothetical protein